MARTRASDNRPDQSDLHEVRTQSRGLILTAALFSAVLNLLFLTGPMFMLQVYDRVLPAHAVETLMALFVLVVFFFSVMGVLEFARSQIMIRVAARVQAGLEARVFSAVMRRNAISRTDTLSRLGLTDLEAISQLLKSRVLLSVMDLMWAPIFFTAIFLFHPLLGTLAIGGAGILTGITLLNRFMTRKPLRETVRARTSATTMATFLQEEAEIIQALGMRESAFRRWQAARLHAGRAEMHASDISSALTSFSRSFRHLLQSAMLAMGAFIVLRAEMTPGAMIAGSILMGRAMAPVDGVLGGWPVIAQGWEAWKRLPQLLAMAPPPPPRIALPRPRAILEAQELTVVPPGTSAPALRLISFTLAPGEALGVIGPSGAGKTSLARTLCGVWPAISGQLRLDGTEIDRYGPDPLGRFIGYLPQRVTLFDGTIAENISRLDTPADPALITAAARRAGAHQMILDLPDGYDTAVSVLGGQLSGGQVQRIGLARALYGDPVLMVLDEPNSNLDADGSEALNTAVRRIKAQGGAVIIMAHRPSAIAECDKLMMLERGLCRAFGPREEVLARTVRNARQMGQVSHIDRALQRRQEP